MYIKHFLRNKLGLKNIAFTDKELVAAVIDMMRQGRNNLMNGRGPDGGQYSVKTINYSEMKVPAPIELFNRVGVPAGNIYADYVRLQNKHPEYFSTPEEVRQHVEFVVSNPSDILEATKREYTLLVRNDGKDRVAVVEFVLRGGKYRVRSAYVMDEGQLEVKKEKALHAVSKPNPEENLEKNIIQGGGVPSDTLRDGLTLDKIVAPSNEEVKGQYSLVL